VSELLNHNYEWEQLIVRKPDRSYVQRRMSERPIKQIFGGEGLQDSD
jgi:hypothetical protein